MAIKSADQITIIDVTDAYSVMLTSEAYTFVGGTSGVAAGQSCITEAVAFLRIKSVLSSKCNRSGYCVSNRNQRNSRK